jgi:hypothetical protein
MPKPPAPESFEVQEYGNEHETQSRFGVIYQIVEQMLRESPAAGCRASLHGNLLRITYNAYESLLPTRLKQVEDAAKQYLNSTISNLKKEYRKKRGKVLELKERKELANYSVEKVSLNERYVYSSWRFYEIGEE